MRAAFDPKPTAAGRRRRKMKAYRRAHLRDRTAEIIKERGLGVRGSQRKTERNGRAPEPTWAAKEAHRRDAHSAGRR